MCGIFGFSGKDHRKHTSSGLKKIAHRGPNETTIKSFKKSNFSFGLNRLAIRDLRKGLYPFWYKHYCLIYNGEIYNVKKLSDLADYECKTTCDVEPVLPLFDKFGIKAFSYLSGMFSIAIFDTKKLQLFLIRDKFGEKPLYYQVGNESVSFSSELKAFQSTKKISSNAVFRYLSLGYQPLQETIFDQIKKLLPGELVSINLKTKEVVKKFYFSKNRISDLKKNHDLTINKSKAVNDLDKLLNKIVREKVVADVPVGCFLSGGIDSSLLTALVAKQQPQRLHTYSIKFDRKSYDESLFAQTVSKLYKTKHTEVLVTASKVSSIWDEVIEKMDEPFADPAIFPTYLLAKEAKKNVTVIISGEGADEFFGGYPRFKKNIQLNLLSFVPDKIALTILKFLPSQKIAKLFNKPELFYTAAHYQTFMKTKRSDYIKYLKLLNQTWKKIKPIYDTSSIPSPLKLFLYDLRYYLGEQLCMKVDKMTMLHSIESRAPYLDDRLFPYMKISAQLLKRGYQDKHLLRKVAIRYLPNKIALRKKQGFSLPLEFWLKEDLQDKTLSLLKPHKLIANMLKPSFLTNFTIDFMNGVNNEALSIWNLVILNSWLNKHY